MNRRNFIQVVGAAIAAAVTSKWPALEGGTESDAIHWHTRPEPLDDRETVEFGWDDMLNDDLDSLAGIPGRIIYVNAGRGKDDLPEDGLSPETAYRAAEDPAASGQVKLSPRMTEGLRICAMLNSQRE